MLAGDIVEGVIELAMRLRMNREELLTGQDTVACTGMKLDAGSWRCRRARELGGLGDTSIVHALDLPREGRKHWMLMVR